MGQALYRKYRSKSLSEIVGQEHITETLVRALETGRISHAYLFSGPRGVGKTSIARILAHEINALPYDESGAHLDIIEIDAASNNGVEDVRDLREKVYIAPTTAKYKVYIIDEVHMLSKAAFNALLKTLEEPPAHAVFVLATTEAHKLPDTIISRTQHYTFKPVEQAKVMAHLRHIASTEGFEIDDEALQLLAAHGEGSFRDSISLLDQAQSLGTMSDKNTATTRTISASNIRQLLGIAPDAAIDALLDALRQGSPPPAILSQLGELYGQGIQAAAVASQLSARLRTALASGGGLLPQEQSLRLMKQLIEVPASRSADRLLEIILLEPLTSSVPQAAAPQPKVAAEQPLAPEPIVAPEPKPISKPALTPDAKPVAKPDAKPAPKPKSAAKPARPVAPSSTSGATLDAAAWAEVVEAIKKKHNTIYGVLRMAQPVFLPGSVELLFKFSFHQKRLNEVKNRQIITDFVQQITGHDVEIICTYAKDAPPSSASDSPGQDGAAAPAGAVAAISDIFGGAEVL